MSAGGLLGRCDNEPVAERLTDRDIACWVLKSRTAPEQIVPGWAAGASQTLTRCLRRSYRMELMAPGQPCLLWLSGQQDPGVQALGRLTSAAFLPPESDPAGREASVTASLRRLEEPVPRRVLLADHVLSGAEVLRMPAGSNPSYLSPAIFEALLELLSPADLSQFG